VRVGTSKPDRWKSVHRLCPYVCSNSAKKSVSDFMLYLKGKSALMLFDIYLEYRNKWGESDFWQEDIMFK